MKSIIGYITLLFMYMMPVMGVWAGDVVVYGFGSSEDTGTLAPTFEAAHISGHTFGAGPSLTSVKFKDDLGADGAVFTAENWPSPLDENKYFQFGVTVADGRQLDVQSVSFDMFKKSGKAPDYFRIRYSLDGVSFTDYGYPRSADYADVWRKATVSQALLGLSGTVYFRIYGYGANATDSRWRLDNVTLDGVVYSGSVNPPDISLNPSGTEKEGVVGQRMEFLVSALDVDGDVVTLHGLNLPEGAVFGPNPATGTASVSQYFYWNPGQTGTWTVAFEASDDDGTNTAQVTIRVVPEAPSVALIVNEYSAVSGSKFLGSDTFAETNCSDSFFGRVEGNGGNWIELVVREDHADIRGWQLRWAEREDPPGEWVSTGQDLWYGAANGVDGSQVKQGIVTFSDDELWSDLRAGTIITIIEHETKENEAGELCLNGSDVSYDPRNGDWWIHISSEGEQLSATPRVTTASNIEGDNPGEFAVGNDDWEASVYNADGVRVIGPVGENAPAWAGGGVSSSEGVAVKAKPQDVYNNNYYDDVKWTTFGAPNVWDDGAEIQEFERLRAVVNLPPDIQPVGDQVVVLGDSLTLQVRVEPTDGDALTLQMVSGPAGSTFETNDNSGVFQWTPASVGNYSASFAATDRDGSEMVTVGIYVVPAGGGGNVLINEVFANPPGSPDNREYIELRGSAGASLSGLTLLQIDSGGGSIGKIRTVQPLTGHSLGANGLLVIGRNYSQYVPYALNPQTTRVDLQGDEELSNEATYLLVRNFSSFLDADLDSSDSGILDFTPWSVIVDSVGMSESDEGYKLYCAARLMLRDGTPDAASRIPGNDQANDPRAWYFGPVKSLTGDPWGLAYDTEASSQGVPDGGLLTPGSANMDSAADADQDGDGLPDDWEMEHFDSLAQGPDGDEDGDGASNQHEYVAGTDPNSAQSHLAILTGGSALPWGGAEPDTFKVVWSAVAGRFYSIDYRDQMSGGWLPLSGAQNITVISNSVQTKTDGSLTGNRRYYRIKVSLP
jgi:hypothetical protein